MNRFQVTGKWSEAWSISLWTFQLDINPLSMAAMLAHVRSRVDVSLPLRKVMTPGSFTSTKPFDVIHSDRISAYGDSWQCSGDQLG